MFTPVKPFATLLVGCPSCGTSLAAGVKDTVNPMPLIAAVCASIVVFGIMIGAAT